MVSLLRVEFGDDLHHALGGDDVRRAPVHLAHPAGHLAHLDGVAHLEGSLHEEHQAGEQVAQGLLEREPHHDGAHPQRGERALQLAPPHELVDQRRGDGDQQHAHQVPQQPGDARPPAARLRGLERRGVDESHGEDDSHHPAGGLDQADPQVVPGPPEHGAEEEQSGDEREEPVPDPPDERSERVSGALERERDLGEHQEHEREPEREPHRPAAVLRQQLAQLGHAAAATSS